MRSRWSTPLTMAAVVAPIVIAAGTVGALASAVPRRTPPSSGAVTRSAAAAEAPATPAKALSAYANLPQAFVENRGQLDARVHYYVQGARFAFYLTRQDVVLAHQRESAAGGAAASGTPVPPRSIALRFVGANPRVTLAGDERAPGTVNDLRGADPTQWRTGIPRYTAVRYHDLWPGIDLSLREAGGSLKYEFHVKPGARVSDIRLAWRNAARLTIDQGGALLVDTGNGVLRDAAPVAFQHIDGVRVPVDSRYALGPRVKDGLYGFALGAYQQDHELVIDPGIEYATFLGGASHEVAAGIAVNAAGNVFVAGTTQSPDFPTTAGAYKRTGAPSNFADVFVSKLNATGTALVYSTFIGGSDFDFARRLAVDAAGNAYITGQTKSSNFPTTGGAFDRTFNIPTCPRCGVDQYDAFVTKLNAAGSALVYSTFLGGTDIDDARDIAVDAAGNAYVTGETLSSDFPTTTGAFNRVYRGNYDIFVSKLNPTGSALVYSTFLGGTNVDNGERVAVDAGGSAYVVGFSSSTDFPVTAGAFDTTANGAFDVTVTRLNAAGSALIFSTYLGGQGFDTGGGLAIDASGGAIVAGGAGSLDFPTTVGAFDTTSDGSDAFVSRLNATGTALTFSTVLGGTSGEAANAVAVDAAGRLWITGVTGSLDFPVTGNAFAPTLTGMADAFVSELSGNGAALLYSTFLGGSQSDSGNAIAVDPSGDVYVAGHTYSLDFPATLGAFDTVFNGDLSIFWGDAFVAKIAIDTDTSTPPAPPGVPPAPTLLGPFNGDRPQQPVTFDWADAPSAVAYTIQIDESSAFTAPLVRQQNVTPSIFVMSGFATTPYFWRVRGINSAGTPGAWSATRTFTPQAAPPPAVLTNLDVNPTTVVGGNGSSGTLIMSAPAPDGGAPITLTSSNSAVVSVPAQVTVPGNSITGTFLIATSAVSSSVTVTITAAYNGSTRTGTLTVTPPGAPPTTSLITLAVSPTTITGGSSVQGVVVLSAAAPPAGAAISLSSSAPGVASAPASVTVPSGATSAVFSIPTTSVSASTAVTMTGTYAGVTRTASLSVTPAAPPPPPPPQTAALTVTVSGRSGERVASSPTGISVATGSSGSASFATGTAITLSVSNGRDAVWSGACSSSGSKRKTCTFTLSGAATVSANVQ